MGNVRYLILMWGAALILVIMGIHALRSGRPVTLWTGSHILPDQVTDVKAYNRAVGKMWCLFSIPFWIIGIIEFWYPAASVVFFAVFCVAEIGGAVWCYHKIEEKYMVR